MKALTHVTTRLTRREQQQEEGVPLESCLICTKSEIYETVQQRYRYVMSSEGRVNAAYAYSSL